MESAYYSTNNAVSGIMGVVTSGTMPAAMSDSLVNLR